MPLYRAYSRPDNAATCGIIKIDAQPEDMKYSQRLRAAVLTGAGPQPKEPTFCPRCRQPATFDSRLCYKYGVAGAWNMACKQCKQVHFPTQLGPSEHDLEQIEHIRTQDREAYLSGLGEAERIRGEKLLSKDKKKCARGVKAEGASTRDSLLKIEDSGARLPTKPNARVANVRAAPEGGGIDGPRPFRTISNNSRITVSKIVETAPLVRQGVDKSNSSSLSARKDSKGKNRASDADEVRVVAVQPSKRTLTSHLGKVDSGVRNIVVVCWEKPDEEPIIERLNIEFGDNVYLFHYPRVRAIPPPTKFECWVLGSNLWSEVPWDITPIEIHPEEDVVFVRVIDVHCRGFGQHLHDLQLKRGHALPAALSIGSAIYDPPHRHVWFLVWTENYARPDFFLFNMALLDDHHDAAPIAMPWLDLLDDAPFFMAWHELHSRWAGVNPNAGHSVSLPGDSPIILLVHPGVEVIQGSGEAIAWLETWRARRAEDRALSKGLQDDIDIKPKLSTPNDSLSPSTLRGAKRAHDQMPNASTIPDCTPLKIARTSSCLRARSYEDGESLELSQSTVQSTQTDTHRVSTGHLGRRTSSRSGQGKGSRANPFVISDDDDDAPSYLTPRKYQRTGRAPIDNDEPEFMEGSSRTPLSSKTRQPYAQPEFVQGLSRTPTKASKNREFDANGQEIIDLSDD